MSRCVMRGVDRTVEDAEPTRTRTPDGVANQHPVSGVVHSFAASLAVRFVVDRLRSVNLDAEVKRSHVATLTQVGPF